MRWRSITPHQYIRGDQASEHQEAREHTADKCTPIIGRIGFSRFNLHDVSPFDASQLGIASSGSAQRAT